MRQELTQRRNRTASQDAADGQIRPRPQRTIDESECQYSLFPFPPNVHKKDPIRVSGVRQAILPIQFQKTSLLHAAESLEAPILHIHEVIQNRVGSANQVPSLYWKQEQPVNTLVVNYGEE